MRWWVALVVLALVAASCGGEVGPDDSGPTSSSHHSSQTTAAPPAAATSPTRYDPDATLNYALPAQPSNWNVLSAAAGTSDVSQVADQVWPSVFQMNARSVPVLNTALVVSATETSTDPQTVVYQINGQAKWSDGVPITYQDFAYNWQAQSGLAEYEDVGGRAYTPVSTAGYSAIASVTGTKAQPDRVTVVWRTPYPAWQSLFSNLMPAHVAEKVGFDTGFTDPVTQLVSGGPYLVQSFQPGQSVTLVRNPGYWGLPANLASITYYFVVDQSRVIDSLGAGALDAAAIQPDPASVAAIRQLPALADGSTVKLSVAGGSTYEDLEDESSRWLYDPALRHAILLAVDRTDVITAAEGQLHSSLAPVGNRFLLPNQPGYQDGSGGDYTSSNVSQAKQVLTTAGYVLANGVLSEAGVPVTLTLASGPLPAATSSSSAPTAILRQDEESAIVDDLDAIGVVVTVAADTGNWDMQLATRQLGTDPAAEAAAYQSGGPGNDEDYSSSAMDKLVGLAEASSPYTAAGAARYDAVDAQAWADFVDLPLFQLPVVVAYASGYLNVGATPNPLGPAYDEQDWGVEDTT